MFLKLLRPKVTRIFRPPGERYQCQFRKQGEQSVTSDSAFDDLDTAMSYVSLVVRFLPQVELGQVVEAKSNEVVFSCLRQAEVKPRHFIREAPTEYAQLVMTGFDPKANGWQPGDDFAFIGSMDEVVMYK